MLHGVASAGFREAVTRRAGSKAVAADSHIACSHIIPFSNYVPRLQGKLLDNQNDNQDKTGSDYGEGLYYIRTYHCERLYASKNVCIQGNRRLLLQHDDMEGNAAMLTNLKIQFTLDSLLERRLSISSANTPKKGEET